MQAMLDGCCRTRKALARAWAPSFSRRFRPATNTLSFSGVPLAEDCLWHSIRASARIYKTHTPPLSTRSFALVSSFAPEKSLNPKIAMGGGGWVGVGLNTLN